jgi:hypothetical protein
MGELGRNSMLLFQENPDIRALSLAKNYSIITEQASLDYAQDDY